MSYPAFFAEIPVIRLRDPLAVFLGASDDGIFEYRYLDAVRLAGHSCPTVAAAWNMTRLALQALYPDELPCRGNIRVELRGGVEAGVTGVIGSVVSLLTGAAAQGGFKGLAGQFGRQNLMHFAAEIPLELRFSRLDSVLAVDVAWRRRLHPGRPGNAAADAPVSRGTRRRGRVATIRQPVAGAGALPVAGAWRRPAGIYRPTGQRNPARPSLSVAGGEGAALSGFTAT
ncbi:hypothetical protein [Dechloromonas denitrificans]|uniref:hypothetical protein n=1 Tax=Dechloromonas denitrificans TaxID=281362 RepID=UPI00299ECF75|nr:hypothetical protein [Dechloromonas denitrificans]